MPIFNFLNRKKTKITSFNHGCSQGFSNRSFAEEANLFAYDNPITFTDSNGSVSRIIDNYRKDGGDLIYGLTNERDRYIIEVFTKNYPDMGKYNFENKQHPPLVIDVYNNAISLEIGNKNLNHLFKLASEPKKVAENIKVPKNIKELVSKYRLNYTLWDEYFAVGDEKPKFNITQLYQETAKKYGESIYHTLVDGFQIGASKLLWKRGSKLGIEIVARSKEVKLHFVLDSLRIDDIVHKSGLEGNSITASELRYAYRNRARLKGKIYFYKEGVQVEAPWEESRLLWEAYVPVRNKSISTNPRLQESSTLSRYFRSFRALFSKNKK